MEKKQLIWETESLIGYEAELKGLNEAIVEEQRQDFDFSGFTILTGGRPKRGLHYGWGVVSRINTIQYSFKRDIQANARRLDMETQSP